MEIKGKIIEVLPLKTGISQNGNEWCKQEYVIETTDNYPRRCAFDVFGSEKIDSLNLVKGEEVTVKLNIDAHEYKGRWYNNITAWDVVRGDMAVTAPQTQSQPQPQSQPQRTAPQQQTMYDSGGSNVQQREGGSYDDNILPF